MKDIRIAVLLAGCGHQDGSEIHEATMTLWAIHKNECNYHCFAPNIDQDHVLNHINGQEMAEKRNVLVESARIARGKISDLDSYVASEYDALIIPGGLGAAKNLSSYYREGASCTVHPSVERAILDTHKAGKPIGALCIAPVILARLIPGVELTLGKDPSSVENATRMGAIHTITDHSEVVVDKENKIVTTPCYMLDARVDQIGEGADKLVREILKLLYS